MNTRILYHRGDEKNAPPNTLLAFEAASRGKADGIELDVQFTSDNVPVVFHDRSIDSHTDAGGYLRDYTLNDLKKIELDIPENTASQKIPTLGEVLDVIEDVEIINIEIKQRAGENMSQERQLIKTVRQKGLLGKAIFSSFNHYTIKNLKQIAPEVKKGIIYYARLFEPWKYAKLLDVDYIVPLYRTINDKLLYEAGKRGLKIIAYGTNDAEDLRQLLNHDVDIIITDEVQKTLELRNEIS